jgi:predicted anti-sigma-YlaC factor YlaD
MTCQELVELVTDYLEDTLASTERERFEQHLGTCSGCRQYLHQMQTVIATTGKLREEDIAPDAREDLLGIFRNWKNEQEE